MTLEGFFDLEDIRANTIDDPNCQKCGLYRQVNTPRMEVSGSGKRKTLFIAEGPGEEEDIWGTQLIGEAGKLLQRNIQKAGEELNQSFRFNRDFWRTNAVNCRPTDDKGRNREPTAAEIEYCRPIWQNAVKELKPNFIILLGGSAIEAFYKHRKNPRFNRDLSITRWRRLCIPDPVTQAWVLPVIHPSFALRSPRMENLFYKDLRYALSCLRRNPPEFKDETKGITVTDRLDDIVEYLTFLKTVDCFSYDFETNALKPYFEESKIFTIGISHDDDQGFSFPYDYPNIFGNEEKRVIRDLFAELVKRPNIRKIVHNITMEGPWTLQNFGPFNNVHDSALTCHVIQERDYYTSLKFQAYINWGVTDYDKAVDPYKTPVGTSNYNRMHMVPWPVICKYNGMDAKFTKRLDTKHNGDRRRPHIKAADEFIQKGAGPLIKMTDRGFPISVRYFKRKAKDLRREVKEKREQILTTQAANEFYLRTGETLDIGSPIHLRRLFFDILGIKPDRYTKKAKLESLDAEALKRIKHPIAQNILEIRQIGKTRDYLVNCVKLVGTDNKIHPSLNFHLVKTYRSSSDGPNLHNFPKRNEEAAELVRRGLLAGSGFQLLGADYGAMEVRGFAWYSKDPVLADELINGMDPHGVWAKFFDCSRFDAKNSFVFPTIYRAKFSSIGREFRARGYSHVTDDMVEEGQRQFWAKYQVGRQWQEKVLADYYQNGYVETFTGFRRRGILSENQIVNYPIQCTCFHCLVWSYCRLEELMETELSHLKSHQIGQIHDENLLRVKENELYTIGPILEQIMVQELMAKYNWINVPPLAEFNLSPINGTWADMQDFTKAHNNDWEVVKNGTWPRAD